MVESALVTLLKADTVLMGYLTGGVYGFRGLGNSGLVKGNALCSAAFTTVSGLPQIKPCAVVRVRGSVSSGERSDTYQQVSSQNVNVEVWLYQYEFYNHIENAVQRIYKLLNFKALPNIGYAMKMQSLSGLSAPEFLNTALWREDYIVKRVQGVS